MKCWQENASIIAVRLRMPTDLYVMYRRLGSTLCLHAFMVIESTIDISFLRVNPDNLHVDIYICQEKSLISGGWPSLLKSTNVSRFPMNHESTYAVWLFRA